MQQLKAWSHRRRPSRQITTQHRLRTTIFGPGVTVAWQTNATVGAVAVALLTVLCGPAGADWPCLRGNPQHTGRVSVMVPPPWHVAWVRSFEGERLGTATEPIVAGGRVFVTTHAGNLYALDATTGEALWRFQTHGPIIHSPACGGGYVVTGSTDGYLYALDAKSGKLIWSMFGGYGGFSAAPVVERGAVYIGTRRGEFLSVNLATGGVLWRRSLGAPVRQTAAVAGNRVYVTSEDIRVHSFDTQSGEPTWISEQLVGQSARDYCPVVVESGGRTLIIIRTNPVRRMSDHLARDTVFLCRNAGVDPSGWQHIDAWIKSPEAQGTPELWEKEQQAIIQYLQDNSDARTFFILDGDTGKPAMTAPVLWAAGCQAVGSVPALTTDGRLLVFYRSAYGNWNAGVAPLVALGLLDVAQNRITPLQHRHGRQPPWNTFWGTADESQSFTVAGDTVLICHQGTLSTFDMRTQELRLIWGDRDTYGGFRSPPWARNEWHGPGRGSAVVSDGRIYWITGSRVLCLATGERRGSPEDIVVKAASVRAEEAPAPRWRKPSDVQDELHRATEEFLSQLWAPLVIEPGLAGREFSFDHNGEVFEALAWSYPHLASGLQARVREFLAREWNNRPPWTEQAWYSLKEGARRELFWTPTELWDRTAPEGTPHPFGNLCAVLLYAERCHEWPRVLESWSAIKGCYEAFRLSGWRLDGAKGDLFANRYLASLLAMERVAERAGDSTTARLARQQAEETAEQLVIWWQRAADQGTLTSFSRVDELDPFIGKGDAISFPVVPHRHKVALLRDLTPEVAALVKQRVPEAVARVWDIFDGLNRTLHLSGEERQVHFGENFIDPPDLALSGFKALAWQRDAPGERLTARLDLPFSRADLYHMMKLAICLEPGRGR